MMSPIKSDPFVWSWFATRECVLEFASARKMYLFSIQPAISFEIQMAKGHVNSVLFVKNVHCTIFFFRPVFEFTEILGNILRENDNIEKT